MSCPKSERSNSCMVIQPNVWNPNKFVRISDVFEIRTNVQPNRREVSEIRTCSDFGRWLYNQNRTFGIWRFLLSWTVLYIKNFMTTLYLKRSSLVKPNEPNEMNRIISNLTKFGSVLQTERSDFGHLLYLCTSTLLNLYLIFLLNISNQNCFKCRNNAWKCCDIYLLK